MGFLAALLVVVWCVLLLFQPWWLIALYVLGFVLAIQGDRCR